MKLPEFLINEIIEGDCLERIKQIPDESIDLILTDPPWAINKKDYDVEKEMDTFRKVIPELSRVLKDRKHILIDMGYTRLFETNELMKDYFIFRQPIILYCNNQIGHRSFAGWNHFRTILWYCKTKASKPNKKYRDVIEFPMKNTKKEGWSFPNPKDVDSYGTLIKMFSDEKDIVLDPFIGSGTTALACIKNKRKYIGFEINPEYIKVAEGRLDHEKEANQNKDI